MTKLAMAMAVALGLSSAALAADRVTCSDGTTSTAGRGACRGHGGVRPMKESVKVKAKRAEQHARSSLSRARHDATSKRHEASASKDRREASTRARTTSRRIQARTPERTSRPAEPAPRAREERSRDASTDAAGAIARCADGTYSHARTHSGACSRHGGVAEWMDRSR